MPVTSKANDQRARRALCSLRGFYPACQSGLADDLRDSLIDLLVDARHFCDKFSFDFLECDRVAEAHYIEERRG